MHINYRSIALKIKTPSLWISFRNIYHARYYFDYDYLAGEIPQSTFALLCKSKSFDDLEHRCLWTRFCFEMHVSNIILLCSDSENIEPVNWLPAEKMDNVVS